MHPIVENAMKRGENHAIYKAIKANLVTIEQVAELYNVAPEEIEEIVKTFSQQEEEDANK